MNRVLIVTFAGSVGLACGGDGPATVGPADADSKDVVSAPDAPGLDGNTPPDSGADASDGAVAVEPAIWSHGYANTTFRHFTALWLAVNYTTGAMLGKGSLNGSGCYALNLTDSGMESPTYLNIPKASCWGGYRSSDYWLSVITTANGYSTADTYSAKNNIVTVPEQNLKGGLRAHAGPGGVMGLDSTTDLISTSTNKFTTNAMAVWVPAMGSRATAANSVPAVIDGIAGSSPSSLTLAGRQDGTQYDYRFSSTGPGPVNGGGFFVAQYGPLMALQSVLLVGGTPLKPASDATAGPDEGISIDNGCVAFAYQGTVNFASGPLTAPQVGHAIAIGDISTNPSKPLVFSFSKGPASAGKTSTPRCILGKDVAQPSTAFYFADTIWDSITIGSDVVKAIHPSGDVIVASVDANGKLLRARLYGGPAAVRASGIVGSTSNNGVIVAGQADQGIDFGNGALPGGAFVAKLPL